MKFLIRDDDTCAFTKVEELIKCYEFIWDEIPINLSVTPFRIPGKDKNVPKQYYDKYEQLDLKNNSDLVAFLREKIKNNRINIALHGYHHYGEKGLPEYWISEGLDEKTYHGKKYLEQVLGCNIDTFVPPNNKISKKGLKAIVKNKLNLIGSPSMWRIKERPFKLKNLYIGGKRFLWKKKNHHNNYPFILDLGTHKEITSYLLYPSTDLEELKKDIEFCYSVDGIFILATHYHAFDKKIKSGETIEYAFKSIIDIIVKKENIEFVTYKEIWS